MKQTIDVTITSDLICPWCWVGLKKLQQAGKQANMILNIKWKPYLLGPNIPEEGKLKNGTPATRVPKSLKQAGESVGINFTGLTDRTPNTILFHSIMKAIQEDDNIIDKSSIVTEFHEAVFEGYFTLGIFPDRDGLLEAARKVNDKAILHKVNKLVDDQDQLKQLRNEVLQEANDAAMAGVNGVPSFDFNGHPVFSGAQPVESFVYYLRHYSK